MQLVGTFWDFQWGIMIQLLDTFLSQLASAHGLTTMQLLATVCAGLAAFLFIFAPLLGPLFGPPKALSPDMPYTPMQLLSKTSLSHDVLYVDAV